LIAKGISSSILAFESGGIFISDVVWELVVYLSYIKIKSRRKFERHGYIIRTHGQISYVVSHG